MHYKCEAVQRIIIHIKIVGQIDVWIYFPLEG